ncbi:MAG: cytochrome P450 [Pyrinomonadaceae bacterium]
MISRLRRLLTHPIRAALRPGRHAGGAPRERPRLLFLFHGGDKVWSGLGRQLYKEAAAFREAVGRCSPAVERSLGFNLSDRLAGRDDVRAGTGEEVERQNIVLLSAVALAMYELWRSRGVEPEGVVGNCSGEIAAAYAAGALTLEEAAEVVCSVAHLVTEKPSQGYFLWLDVGFDEALRLSRKSPARLEVVVDLSPVESLAYCPSAEFADVQRFLSESGVGLHATNAGPEYHTPGSNALSALAGTLYQPRPRPLARPFYSAHAGGLFPAGTLLSADHWYRAAVEPVMFGHAMCAALADGYNVMLHVCGHTSLKAGVEQSAAMLNKRPLILETMRRGESELATWKASFRRLSESGLVGPRAGRGGRGAAPTSNGAAAADAVNLLSPEVVRDPYPHYAALRRSGSVHFLKEHGFWLVLDYDDVVRAIKQPQQFSSVRPAVRFDPVLTESDPPAHTRVRRILSPYFSTQSAHALEGYVRDCAVRLLRESERPAEFDLVSSFAEPLTELTITRLLGLSEQDTESIRRHLAPHKRDGLLFTKLEEWVRDYVARLLARPDESMGSRLLLGEGEAALTPEEVVTLLKLLWAAGTHTTERLISTSSLLLLRHPAVRDEVQASPGLLPAFVEEALRLDTPELMAWRSTRAEVEVAGVTIPAGADVKLCIAAANHDPAQFPEPERLSLRRNPNNHLSFAAGPHFCLGASLARMEARVALETLLTEWPDFGAARPLHTISYVEEYHSRTLKELFVTAV